MPFFDAAFQTGVAGSNEIGLFFNVSARAASIHYETSIVLMNDRCCSSYGLLGVRSCRAAFKKGGPHDLWEIAGLERAVVEETGENHLPSG